MKKFKKVLRIIALIIFIPLTIILIARGVNSFRYPKSDNAFPSGQLEDSQYPLTDDFGNISLINQGRAQGFHMVPDSGTEPKGTIVTFGGSEGSPNYKTAYSLYQEGYEVFAMYFFGKEGLPPAIGAVDVGFFEDVQDYVQQKAVRPQPLTVLGISKGAELTLLLTQYYDSIDNIVLYAPSAYVFQGLDMTKPSSSWSYHGEELPYLSFQDGSFKAVADMFGAMIFKYPLSFRESYQSISQSTTPDSPQWIYKTPMEGNILVFAGGDDAMWPSDLMGQALADANPQQVEFHLYEGAGHIFIDATYGGGFAFGGTSQANVDAGKDSTAILLQRLAEWQA